jgi:hypothetical protein
LLAKAGLPAGLAEALDDPRRDDEIRAEGEEALSLTGRDVGTPIILRERPQLRSFGADPGTAGTQEDWHAGRRKPPA